MVSVLSEHTTAGERLAAFFQGCEKNFRFLEERYGFNYLSGLAQYREGRLVFSPYQPGSAPGHFEAVTLYEGENATIEIAYHAVDEVFSIHACFNRIHRLELKELLKAARKSLLPRRDGLPAPKTLEETLTEAADEVRKHAEFLNKPNQKVLQRALAIREKLIEEKVRGQYKRELEQAVREAAHAFAGKDYRRVIELYTPFLTHLSFAELKKLEIARKSLARF